MAYITLHRRSGPDLEALVDDEDYERLSQRSWHAHFVKGHQYTFYVRSTRQKPDGSTESTLMHREVLGLKPGDSGIDHINGHGWDNRKENLREATQLQNNYNRRAWGKCQYIGVSWYQPRKTWRAVIYQEGAQILVGYFKDEKEAAMAFDRKALELRGDRARLNFPDSQKRST